jgi:hypothetical protein
MKMDTAQDLDTMTGEGVGMSFNSDSYKAGYADGVNDGYADGLRDAYEVILKMPVVRRYAALAAIDKLGESNE